jgi:hypothetical protein
MCPASSIDNLVVREESREIHLDVGLGQARDLDVLKPAERTRRIREAVGMDPTAGAGLSTDGSAVGKLYGGRSQHEESVRGCTL